VKPAIIALLLLAGCAFAQKDEHVQWSLALERASAPPGAPVLARLTGIIDPGWHLYSMSTAAAMPTTILLADNAVVKRYRALQPPPKKTFDPNFNSDTETYEGVVTFLLELEIEKSAAAGPAQLTVNARFQTCNDKQCVPGRWTGVANLTVDPSVKEVVEAIPAGYLEAKPAQQQQDVRVEPQGGNGKLVEQSSPIGGGLGWGPKVAQVKRMAVAIQLTIFALILEVM